MTELLNWTCGILLRHISISLLPSIQRQTWHVIFSISIGKGSQNNSFSRGRSISTPTWANSPVWVLGYTRRNRMSSYLNQCSITWWHCAKWVWWEHERWAHKNLETYHTGKVYRDEICLNIPSKLEITVTLCSTHFKEIDTTVDGLFASWKLGYENMIP